MQKVSGNYPDLTLKHNGKKWTLQPKKSWIDEIVTEADNKGVAVYQGESLAPTLGNKLRREIA